jgi:hypothetical protein
MDVNIYHRTQFHTNGNDKRGLGNNVFGAKINPEISNAIRRQREISGVDYFKAATSTSSNINKFFFVFLSRSFKAVNSFTIHKINNITYVKKFEFFLRYGDELNFSVTEYTEKGVQTKQSNTLACR